MNDHSHNELLDRDSGRNSIGRREFLTLMIAALLSATSGFAQTPGDPRERFRKMSEEAERRGLAEPFKGITTDGTIRPGLFHLRSTGVSTAPVSAAATAFLGALTPAQREKTVFTVDDPEWRKWMNQHFYVRQGVSFRDMDDAQRSAAFLSLDRGDGDPVR